MTRLTNRIVPAIVAVAAVLLGHAGLTHAKEVPEGGICTIVVTDTPPPVLQISSKCTVPPSTKPYKYKVISIQGNSGELIFDDANGSIDFWAEAIIIENGGKLTIGKPDAPIGGKDPKTVVTIHLYGATQAPGAAGVPCNSSSGGGAETCGAPKVIWDANVDAQGDPKSPTECADKAVDVSNCVRRVQAVCDGLPAGPAKDECNKYPGPKDDFFYAYHPLFHDAGDHHAYFGNKVIGVGYGGSLQIVGKKGACTSNCDKPQTTGQSWVRLTKNIGPTKENTDADRTFTVSSPVDWKAGDQIVITTTDYIPSHSEQLTVASDTNNGTSVTVKEKIKWAHNGSTYPLSSASNLNPVLKDGGADVRAAVGLLSRNVRIVSGGAEFGKDLPTVDSTECTGGDGPSTNKCYFGGHVVIRQGFKQVQIQGAEFYQLGQGGRLGHYPIHFHHARRTPPETYVVDSSVWDSMTRWIVLHGTQDVTLARNVGYLSIGHGYYLEDATEINNKLVANLGVFARAAVALDETSNTGPNTRRVPGILAANNQQNVAVEAVPYRSDFDHPTVFWIMNGWNDFQYNMASGAGTCGVCYWLVPGANSTMSRNPQFDSAGSKTNGQKWDSYASMQSSLGRASMTPLKTFIGNVCSTAQMSFNTVGNVEPCPGVLQTSPDGFPVVKPIANELSPNVNLVGPEGETPADTSKRLRLDYYPTVDGTGGRFATKCDGATTDCSVTPDRCNAGTALPNCMITHLEQYTSSFTWAPFNFAALWLRPQWYLVSNSVISDIIMGGLNFVTGGGYTESDRITGHWALVRKSAFIGQTQPDTNGYALDGGPFNPTSGLHCDTNASFVRPGNRCTDVKDGVVFATSNLGFSQRFFSVYDGPAFQESNAYFRIKPRVIDDCVPFQDANALVGFCDPPNKKPYIDSAWLAGTILGLPKGTDNKCYMPNAAIGWKQPNGFYYPPAFHSANLYFNDDVEIRHFVIEPLFKPDGTTDVGKTGTCPGPDCKPTGRVPVEYCKYNEDLFLAFTDIDRQTVLNDDDGSLTGFKSPTDGTIAVNTDEFFKAPIQAIECGSNRSAITSPYEYVTTVVYPGCATRPSADGVDCANPLDKGYSHLGDWDTPCSTPGCLGIPMSRLDGLRSDSGTVKTIRLLGQNVGQRSSLTVNQGTYYIDTTTGVQKAKTYCAGIKGVGGDCAYTAFKPRSTYYLFQIYAKPTTKQTYQIYVGKGSTAYDPTDPNTVWMVQGDIGKKPIPFTKQSLPTGWITGKDAYNATTGILTVTIDLSTITTIGGKSLKALFKDARKNNCKPATYCTWDGGSDSDAGTCKDLLPLSNAEPNAEPGAKTDTVCRWGAIDVDCPDGGCIGIGFKTADTFKNSDDAGFAPPTPPTPIPALCSTVAKKSPFDVPLVKVTSGICPLLGPPPKGDDLALDFFDVKCTAPADCSCPQ